MLDQTMLSECRACRLAGLSRDSFRHPSEPTPATQALSARIIELAQVRRKFGYRRLHDLLRPEFPDVNHKKVYRLYSEASLAMRRRYGDSGNHALTPARSGIDANAMSIDLIPLNLRELNTLIRAAQDRHRALTEREPAAKVRRMLIAQAQRAGYTIEELFGLDAEQPRPAPKGPRRRKRARVEPKYRDPDNRRNTWTGRGRMPRWLAAKTKHGRSVADFLIPGVARLTPKAPATGRRRLVKQN